MIMLSDFEFSRREIFKRSEGKILNRHETSQYFPSSSSLISISLAGPRRQVKCPVSECEFTGRIDNARVHLRHLIVWSSKNEGEAAGEDEMCYKVASKA